MINSGESGLTLRIDRCRTCYAELIATRVVPAHVDYPWASGPGRGGVVRGPVAGLLYRGLEHGRRAVRLNERRGHYAGRQLPAHELATYRRLTGLIHRNRATRARLMARWKASGMAW